MIAKMKNMKDNLVLPSGKYKTNFFFKYQKQAKCFAKRITSPFLLNYEDESFFDE